MTKKERAALAVSRLKERYPEAICSLNYDSPWQLLVATRLSAQCTDARVNLVTPALFSRYPTMHEMAAAEVTDVEKLIYSCGFYKTKAKDLVEMSRLLIEKHDGIVPDTIEVLITLPGVGRKTANLVVGDIYRKPAVVTDTHCIRISRRLGLTDTDTPVAVEKELRALLPPEESNDFCHRLVLFGRDTCTARSPKCTACPLSEICLKKF